MTSDHDRAYPLPATQPRAFKTGWVVVTVEEYRLYLTYIARLRGVTIAMRRWLGTTAPTDAGDYRQGFADGVQAPLRDIQRAMGTDLPTGTQAGKP